MSKSSSSSEERRRAASRKGRYAFTLVELLVVVAIIALLVSILLPTLGKAKEQARIVVCLSNHKSLGLAFAQYAAANDDWYPACSACGGVIYGDGAGPEYAWDTVLKSDYNSHEMLRCPSDKIDRSKFYVDYNVPEDKRYPKSYAMNGDVSWMGPSLYCGDTRPWPFGVKKTTAVTNPAETVLLGEMWDSDYGASYGSSYYHYAPNVYGAYQGSYTGFYGGATEPWAGRTPTFFHRNDDSANFLFCDGHAVPLPEDDPSLNAENDYYYYFRVKP